MDNLINYWTFVENNIWVPMIFVYLVSSFFLYPWKWGVWLCRYLGCSHHWVRPHKVRWMAGANWAHPLLLIPERRGHDLGKKTICQRPPPPTLEKSIDSFARTFALLCNKTFWLVIRIVKHCWPSICFCPGSTYCCIGLTRDGRYFPVCVICSVNIFADLYVCTTKVFLCSICAE